MAGQDRQETLRQGFSDSHNVLATQLREAVEDVFAVEDVTYGTSLGQPQREHPVLRLRGRLMLSAEEAFEIVAPRFEALDHTLLLRREDGRDVIYGRPGVVRPTPSKRWVNAVLFVLTVISVLFTGATAVGVEAESL